MDHIYKQPKYFREFRCIGGECPESCCDGWHIDWKISELENLRLAEISETLKNNVNLSFYCEEGKDYYTIKLCEDGRCPFHDRETGLCNIQRELGEKYLGIVCRQYPRHFIENGNYIIRWCVTSCPAIIDILTNNEDAAEIENVLARDQDKIDRSTVVTDSSDAIKKDPIKKKRIELFDFYTRMLLNNTRSIETSIVLTALAVKHLTNAEGKHDFNVMTKIIQDLEPQLNNLATIKSVEEINPNYQLKFKIVNNMLVKFFGNNSKIINIRMLHDGYQLNVENYLKGLENFNAAFENKTYVLKNIITNTFYDMNMPLGKLKRPLFENYAYFALAAASIKTVAAAIGFSGENIKEKFKTCVAEMSRSFSHDIQKADAIAEEIKQMGLTSPAHLALIIKG